MRLRPAFALGVLALALFELACSWFVMPMPGSQRLATVELAYSFYQWRWWVRGACVFLVLVGLRDAWRGGPRWGVGAALGLVAAAAVTGTANFLMAADQMFLQPLALVVAPADKNKVPPERLVVGVEIEGDARAYPVMFIGYHHQVRDKVGGKD